MVDKLLDSYERRQGYLKDPHEMKVVQFKPEDFFP